MEGEIDSFGRIEAALRASFIFPVLGPAERRRFVSSARPLSCRAGETIFLMGHAGDSMLLIEEGEVRISYPSEDGRAVTLSELSAGAIFGEIALLDGGTRSADATAVTDCRLLSFQREDFVAMLAANWSLAEAVLKLVCQRLRRSDERMADLAFFDLPGRLAKALVSRAHIDVADGEMRVADSHAVLAGLVGGSRDGVSLCLHRWERAGLVAMAEGYISILDPEALTRGADQPVARRGMRLNASSAAIL